MIAKLFMYGFTTETLSSGVRTLTSERRLAWHCF